MKKTLLRTTLLATASLTLASFAFAAGAQDNWSQKCAMCHAPDGAGRKALKTQDFTSADVQAKLTDDGLSKAITDGIAGTHMPAYKDKLSADEIKDLVAYIRAMKK